ncbi:MAG: acyl-CoA thioesterase, partial [Planctomycetes bacterium]|nr:acyl-CoA thioesterase [Planctomycetota bacterium]
QMGVVHHSRYLSYFEMGRVELMRAIGLPHVEQEDRGEPHSIRSVDVRYVAPARYDDVLELTTSVPQARGAQVVFEGRLWRVAPEPRTLVAEATQIGAAVTPEGKVRRLTPRELAAFNGPARDDL